jgi:hypothetical protein
MGLFGLNLSFSKQKGKTSNEETLAKNETTNQNQSTNTSSTQSGTQNTSQTNQSTGTSTTNQTGTQTAVGTKTSDVTGKTSQFSDAVLGGLEDLVSGLFGNPNAVNPAVAGMGSFDSRAYVSDAVTAAKATQQSALDATSGAIADRVGARAGNSSMGDLLLARSTNDAAAALGGVRAQAESTAAGIDAQRAQIGLGAQAQDQGFLAQMLAALKGGQAITTQTGTEGTTGTTTTANTGTTATSEAGTQNTASTSTQTLQQLVDAILSGTTATTGKSTSKGTSSGSTMGAGANLGK